MTKAKIVVNEVTTFESSDNARNYMLRAVEAGIVFIKCEPKTKEGVQKYIVSIDNVSYFQTTREARERLEKYLKAGITLLEVERWYND